MKYIIGGLLGIASILVIDLMLTTPDSLPIHCASRATGQGYLVYLKEGDLWCKWPDDTSAFASTTYRSVTPFPA